MSGKPVQRGELVGEGTNVKAALQCVSLKPTRETALSNLVGMSVATALGQIEYACSGSGLIKERPVTGDA